MSFISFKVDRNYFYFNLRHPKNCSKKILVVSLPFDKKGHYFILPVEYRDPNKHVHYSSKINNVSFEFYKNVKVDLTNEDQKKFYFNEKDEFQIENVLLSKVDSVDEIECKYFINF